MSGYTVLSSRLALVPRNRPDEQFGSFYSGDSYIILQTREKADGGGLEWDVFFWVRWLVSNAVSTHLAAFIACNPVILSRAPIVDILAWCV